MERETQPRRVALLPEAVARRIAAGEVIERPASVVRELLDNSIDAGAEAITVEIGGGGLETIRVDDDGQGMSREDLELCWQPHATSKIRTAEDLASCHTLGFRGEALSSIAAVSRLEIRSRPAGADQGHRILVEQNKLRTLEAAPTSEGTTISVQGLFYNLPARKRFLKRPQSEAQQVKRVLLEKALPVPEIRFRLLGDGKEKLLLPSGSLEERVSALFGDKVPPQALHRIDGSGEGFSITLVVADPSHVRRDRKQIHPFVNGRRLKEFALIQAVEYAFTDVMHGGLFPYAAVLVEVDPELVDFNIHPAKQEARFRNMQEIHHRVVELLRSFLRSYERKRLQQFGPDLEGMGTTSGARDGLGPARGPAAGDAPAEGSAWRPTPPGRFRAESRVESAGGPGGRPAGKSQGDSSGGSGRGSAGDKGRREPRRPFDVEEVRRRFGHAGHAGERGSDYTAATNLGSEDTPGGLGPGSGTAAGSETGSRGDSGVADDGNLRYYGQLFEVFLLVRRGKTLFIIDQHASHERLLYDAFRKDRAIQQLLVPYRFEATEDQSAALERNRSAYGEIGISLEDRGEGIWEITALPQAFREEEESLVATILELRGLSEEFDRRFTAELACKAAMKRGDILDELSGEELARKVLALENPRCPHGRPLWFALTEAELFQLIGRSPTATMPS